MDSGLKGQAATGRFVLAVVGVSKTSFSVGSSFVTSSEDCSRMTLPLCVSQCNGRPLSTNSDFYVVSEDITLHWGHSSSGSLSAVWQLSPGMSLGR